MNTAVYVLLLACVCSASALPQSAYVGTRYRYDDQQPSGAFRTAFQTDNGINFDETGYLKPTNDRLDNVVAKKGSYSYTSPEGVPVVVNYVADEYGFNAQGNVLPQPVQPVQPVFA